jgi:Proton-conducting membrane transporter
MASTLLGCFSDRIYGLVGSIIFGLAHGFVSPGLFYVVGAVLYDRCGSRVINYYRGLTLLLPLLSLLFLILVFGNMSVPLTANFLGEFLSLLGAYQQNIFITSVATISVILSAIYSIFMYNRVSSGYYSFFLLTIPDIFRKEYYTLFPLLFITLAIGIYPNFIISDIEFSLSNVLLINFGNIFDSFITDTISNVFLFNWSVLFHLYDINWLELLFFILNYILVILIWLKKQFLLLGSEYWDLIISYITMAIDTIEKTIKLQNIIDILNMVGLIILSLITSIWYTVLSFFFEIWFTAWLIKNKVIEYSIQINNYIVDYSSELKKNFFIYSKLLFNYLISTSWYLIEYIKELYKENPYYFWWCLFIYISTRKISIKFGNWLYYLFDNSSIIFLDIIIWIIKIAICIVCVTYLISNWLYKKITKKKNEKPKDEKREKNDKKNIK